MVETSGPLTIRNVFPSGSARVRCRFGAVVMAHPARGRHSAVRPPNDGSYGSGPSDEESGMATLTVWRFDTPDGADDAVSAVELLARQDLITVHDGATVAWHPGA